MATKSFLKNIVVNDNKAASALVNALENAQHKKSIHVSIHRKVYEAKGNSIKRMFEGK